MNGSISEKECPNERWTTLYEIWHAEKGVKVYDDLTATGTLVQGRLPRGMAELAG